MDNAGGFTLTSTNMGRCVTNILDWGFLRKLFLTNFLSQKINTEIQKTFLVDENFWLFMLQKFHDITDSLTLS